MANKFSMLAQNDCTCDFWEGHVSLQVRVKVAVYELTNVKMFSDCVIKATLDHPNSFMAAVIPTATSASLDTVLRNSGNNLLLERRGDEDPADI